MRLSLRSVYLLRTRQHGVARVAPRAVLRRMRRTRRCRLAGPPDPQRTRQTATRRVPLGGQRLGSSSSAGVAWSQQGHVEVVRVLLAANADVDARSDKGAAPLMVGAENGHVDVVQASLGAKADVNAKAVDGFTALHLTHGFAERPP